MLYLKKEDALMTDAVQFALTELERYWVKRLQFPWNYGRTLQ